MLKKIYSINTKIHFLGQVHPQNLVSYSQICVVMITIIISTWLHSYVSKENGKLKTNDLRLFLSQLKLGTETNCSVAHYFYTHFTPLQLSICH